MTKNLQVAYPVRTCTAAGAPAFWCTPPLPVSSPKHFHNWAGRSGFYKYWTDFIHRLFLITSSLIMPGPDMLRTAIDSEWWWGWKLQKQSMLIGRFLVQTKLCVMPSLYSTVAATEKQSLTPTEVTSATLVPILVLAALGNLILKREMLSNQKTPRRRRPFKIPCDFQNEKPFFLCIPPSLPLSPEALRLKQQSKLKQNRPCVCADIRCPDLAEAALSKRPKLPGSYRSPKWQTSSQGHTFTLYII